MHVLIRIYSIVSRLCNPSKTLHAGLLVMFLCYYLFVSCSGVEGIVTLSREEDLKLEKQLRILNKPAIKTMKTDYGDIYDCVDFFKQPAFDHPLLRNHSYHYQMKPPSVGRKNSQFSVKNDIHIGIKNGDCPVGTVLIKRITKEDLIRQKLASKDSTDGTILAVASTVLNDVKYTGALGYITIYKPAVTGSQYSAARIKLQNGNEYLEFGWRTNSAKCFDARCGFVVSPGQVTPGFTYPPDVISIPGGSIHEETLLRVRRESDGNWWLTIGHDFQPIGFWPSKLFSEMTNIATYADWGGKAYSPPDVAGPEMGSGYLPSKNEQYDALIRVMTAFDDSGNEVNPDTTDYIVNDSGTEYDVIDDNSDDPVYGHTVWFGGPKNAV